MTGDTGARPALPLFIEISEWDWVWAGGGRRLHCVESADNPEDFERSGLVTGVTTCGYEGRLEIPGIFSRMGTPRCTRCCDRLGIKHGDGSPKNDPELRPFVKARLRALSEGSDGNGD